MTEHVTQQQPVQVKQEPIGNIRNQSEPIASIDSLISMTRAKVDRKGQNEGEFPVPVRFQHLLQSVVLQIAISTDC